MKWIGQNIWDFISRFRGEVYIENLSTTTETNVLVVDSAGKVSKNTTTVGGDITGVTAGNALTGGGTSGALTINHEDTSSQASVDNSGSTYVQDVTLDTYGHVTGLTSAAIPTLNQDTSGEAATVATIAGLAPNTATSQATQPNITTMTGFVTGSANEILTDDGDGTVTSESNLTWDGDHFLIESATSQKPLVEIKSTTNSNKGSLLKFVSDKGGAGLDGDGIGAISWFGDDAAQTQTQFGLMGCFVEEADASDKTGKFTIDVLESNGSGGNQLRNVLTGTGKNDNTVDVDLAYGASSTTTIAGNLTMGSTAAMTNAGLLSVAAQTNVTSLGTLTGLTTSGTIELGHASDTTLARGF